MKAPLLASMGKAIHPVASLEEGQNPGPAVHPRLFVSRSDTSLEVSVMPKPESRRFLASSLIHAGVMLLVGSGMVVLVIVTSQLNWPPLVTALLWIFGAVFSVSGITGLIFIPKKLVSESVHEVVHVGPEEVCVRRILWGLTLGRVTTSRPLIQSLHLRLTNRLDGSTAAVCIISGEGLRIPLFSERLNQRAQRHVLSMMVDYLGVALGPDEWTNHTELNR